MMEESEYGWYKSTIRSLAIRPHLRRLTVPLLSLACAEELSDQLELLKVSFFIMATSDIIHF